MKKIRNNIFETNSSSTHAICFGDDINNLPKSIRFDLDYFGRSDGFADRYDYLFTAICDYYGVGWEEKWNWVKDVLKKHGCEAINDVPKFAESGWSLDYWGVDHSNELEEFLSAIVGNEDLLLKYLTSDKTFIEMSEDNGWETYENCTLPHKFMKGN